MTFDSVTTPDYNTFQNTILYPGWNIIRWPFTFIQQPTILNSSKIGSTWERTKTGWIQATELKPFGGYAIYNKTASNIQIGEVLGWTNPSKVAAQDENKLFEVALTVNHNQDEIAKSYIGTVDRNPDTYSEAAPFALGNELKLSMGNNLSAQFYQDKADIHTWEGEISDPGKHDKINLSWAFHNNKSDYIAYLIDIDNNRRVSMSDVWNYEFDSQKKHKFQIIAGPTASVQNALDKLDQKLPTTFSLKQNFPNPFNPQTTIRYDLAKSGNVELVVYNMLGQKIKTLISAFQRTGMYSTTWDGTSENGMRVGSGVYIYRLKTQETTITKKMLFLK